MIFWRTDVGKRYMGFLGSTVGNFLNVILKGAKPGEVFGITLTAGPGADGLFVGIPDDTIPGGNNANFFAADFFPVSEEAVFSPDNYPSPNSPSPDGTLIVDFDYPTSGVGAYFLDAEGFPSYIEAFDGPGGTGDSLGKLVVQGYPDNSQIFAGIAASGIRSAVLVLGGGGDGVGLDDLCFVAFEVTIDIKPGSDPNCFNSNDHGVIPVAILGSADFDVSIIDPFTVFLDGQAVRVKGKSGNAGSYEDVNGDGFTDLVVQIMDEGSYLIGDTTGTISAESDDGVIFWGQDSICITQ